MHIISSQTWARNFTLPDKYRFALVQETIRIRVREISEEIFLVMNDSPENNVSGKKKRELF